MSGLVNEGLSFAFPHRVMQLETMRYNRAKIVFQAMSSVLTETIYYEQMILTGLLLNASGERSNARHARIKPVGKSE